MPTTCPQHFGNSSIPYIDFSNTDLIALTSALSPAVLRIGGSGEDSVIYNISDECNEPDKWNISGNYYCSEVKPADYYCLSTTRWTQILSFCDATNIDLVYGLNACYGRRNADEQMDMSNIDALLSYTVAHADTLNVSRLRGFEFGNSMDGHIDAQIYAYDFIRMNTLVQRYFANRTAPVSMGTDNNYMDTAYVTEVLGRLPNGTMSVLNWHQYTNCDEQDAQGYVFSAACLATITQYPAVYANILRQTGQTQATLMIGESALDHSGGKNNASNVFLSSFYYAFQLCELSQVDGMDLVQRQTLSGGWYGLLDTSFAPMPDYWVLYLWRQLVGEQVLRVELGKNDNVTAYAYTGKQGGHVTVVLINFSLEQTANVRLELSGGASSAWVVSIATRQ